MAKRPTPPVEEPENPWPGRLKALQEKLGLDNDQMAEKLGVPARTWLSWKYGERRPSVAAARLVELAEAGRL
jgi:DNA-binding transcriptional regulator YiaG